MDPLMILLLHIYPSLWLSVLNHLAYAYLFLSGISKVHVLLLGKDYTRDWTGFQTTLPARFPLFLFFKKIFLLLVYSSDGCCVQNSRLLFLIFFIFFFLKKIVSGLKDIGCWSFFSNVMASCGCQRYCNFCTSFSFYHSIVILLSCRIWFYVQIKFM